MSFDEESETRGYLLGISVGLEKAADILLDVATDKFRAGDDETADLLRDSARRLREIGSQRRTEYEEYKREHKEPEE